MLFSRVNLIVANDLDTLAACYLASRLRRCPLVYDSHEYFTEVPELLHRPTVRRIWLWIEKKILPSIKTSYTVCQSIATIYREKYGIPMQVIPNYPNQKKQVEPTQKNKHQRIILYQGMLNMGRGIELAIASMQNTQDMLLWIIGDGYMKKSLAAHVKAHDVQEKVVFLGKIFEPELSQYTRQASLGISLEEDLGENYRYALPNKLFSYIQAGVPVIVSDLPEMKKIVSHYQNGCILSERTPEKLAALYKKMFNASDYEGYRERTREAANELIWEKQEETLFKLYEPYLS